MEKIQPLAGLMPKRVRQASPGFTLDREAGQIECINLGCGAAAAHAGLVRNAHPFTSTHPHS